MGESSNYTPMTLNFSAGPTSGAYITTYVKNTVAPGFVSANFVNYISRYWSIEPTGMSGTPTYTVTYTYLDSDVTGDETNLIPVKVSGTTWYKPAEAVSITNGTVQGSGSVNTTSNLCSWSGLTTFSFDMAAGDEAAALPIQLLYFTAKQQTNRVRLDWSTASEINNDYFTVERSEDGEYFNELFKKSGAGMSNTNLYYFGYDNKPLAGTSYYRLKQTDFDGKNTYSNIESIYLQQESQIEGLKIYPNPSVDNTIHLDFSGKSNQVVKCILQDAIGKEIAVHIFDTEKGSNNFVLSYPEVASGMYMLEIQSVNEGVQQVQLQLGK